MPSKLVSRLTSARYIVSAGGSSSGIFIGVGCSIIRDGCSMAKLDVFMNQRYACTHERRIDGFQASNFLKSPGSFTLRKKYARSFGTGQSFPLPDSASA